MTTVDEAYFLVRVGSWTQEDLERWVADQIFAALNSQEEQIRNDIKEEERYKRYTTEYGSSYGNYRDPWHR